MITLPVRSAPLLAATVKPTVPFPLPVSGGVSVIQPTSVLAVHAQSLLTATVTLPDPALASMDWLAGATWYRQGARCETRTRLSLTAISPSRADDPSLGATRNSRSALPCPEVGVNPEIQFTVDEGVHAHSGCVVTATLAAPPPASIVDGVLTDS